MHVDNRGTGMMDLREALNTSWNIPAYWTYRTLREKGVDVPGYMEKMGYDIAEYGIESLPMGGGIEVSVAQHTNGYQTLANNGNYQNDYMIEKNHGPKTEKLFTSTKANQLELLSSNCDYHAGSVKRCHQLRCNNDLQEPDQPGQPNPC